MGFTSGDLNLPGPSLVSTRSNEGHGRPPQRDSNWLMEEPDQLESRLLATSLNTKRQHFFAKSSSYMRVFYNQCLMYSL